MKRSFPRCSSALRPARSRGPRRPSAPHRRSGLRRCATPGNRSRPSANGMDRQGSKPLPAQQPNAPPTPRGAIETPARAPPQSGQSSFRLSRGAHHAQPLPSAPHSHLHRLPCQAQLPSDSRLGALLERRQDERLAQRRRQFVEGACQIADPLPRDDHALGIALIDASPHVVGFGADPCAQLEEHAPLSAAIPALVERD